MIVVYLPFPAPLTNWVLLIKMKCQTLPLIRTLIVFLALHHLDASGITSKYDISFLIVKLKVLS